MLLSTLFTLVLLTVNGFADPIRNRFRFPVCAIEPHNVESSHLFPMRQCWGYEIEDASLERLQDYMTSGDLTSVQLAQCYLDRYQQTNSYINSILEINPELLTLATELDDERAKGHVRGPLHGIPFAVKDSIATADRMQTTAGSWALLGARVPRDAFVVHRLREAGALLMGKTTLSEWADMRSSNYSEGYSARGGQCRSAYNFTVNPGGSSSGSAVGVAANVFPFALGVETDGSVINPAHRNAIVGIKPTVGLTSRAGVIPESEHQDTVGCLAKSVHDAALVLDVIAGPDPRDNYTQIQIGHTPPPVAGRGQYSRFTANKTALRNATFGLPWMSFWQYCDSDQLRELEQIVQMIQDAGATVINGTELPDYELVVSPDGWDWDYGTKRGYPNESEFTVVKVDFYINIQTYLSELSNTPIRTLEDIVAYNFANDGSEGGHPWPLGHPAFYSGQDSFLASLATRGVRDEVYFQALNFCQSATREYGLDAALSISSENSRVEVGYSDTLDALLVPSSVAQSHQVAAQAGYPIITVPAGVQPGAPRMPFGLSLMQTAWREDRLVTWASAIEDLLRDDRRSKGHAKRPQPQWYGHLQRNIPVLND